jgi:hypothetical protein
MKQPEDNKTMELPLAKRGRGRPKLEHALSQAERAKRYRDNKRAQKNSDASIVTENAAPDRVSMMASDQANELEKRVQELAQKLSEAHQTINALRKEQALLIEERKKAYEAYANMKEQSKRWVKDRDTVLEQTSALSNLVAKLEDKVARRDKTIKQLRDEAKRHA